MRTRKEVKSREAKFKMVNHNGELKREKIKYNDQASYNIPQDFFDKLLDNGVIQINEELSKLPEMIEFDKVVYQLSSDYTLEFSDTLKEFIGEELINDDETLLIEAGSVKPQIRFTTYEKFGDGQSVWFKTLYETNTPGNVMIYEFNIETGTFLIDIEENK